MKHKIFAFIMLLAFLLSAAALAFADTKGKKKAVKTSQMLTLLPASDAALVFDAKRFFGEALPQILSGNQPMLGEINGKIDEIKSKTGIDFRQFQQVAVGANLRQDAASEINVEPIILARGQFSAAALVALAKLASNGKYREEKIGDRLIYIFSAKEVIEQHKGKITNSMIARMIDKMMGSLNQELAVTTYDNNTLAIGTLPRVREMFDARAVRLGGEVLDSIARRPDAIISFAAKTPTGLAQFMKLDNDELGKNLGAIRLISGSLDATKTSTVLAMSVKTVDVSQANDLKALLTVFQSIGKAQYGTTKGDDKKAAIGRLIENARIGQTGNEITLDLQVPQTDISLLIGKKE